MKSLQKLAARKAICDRRWIKELHSIPKDLQQMLLEECVESNNIAAFELLVLSTRGSILDLKDNQHLTEQFALTIYNCIKNKNSRWKETRITAIDISGCEIGPKATESFAKLALGGTKASGGFGVICYLQDWLNAEVRPQLINLNLHVTKDTFEIVKLCLEESDTLKPSGLKAEAIGIKRICQLLDQIIEKGLELLDLDVYMNSLMRDGVSQLCKRLKNLKGLRKLNLGYPMISEEDGDVVVELCACLRKMTNLQELKLDAATLGHHFMLVLNSLSAGNLRHLDLSHCGLEGALIQVLADVLKNSPIQTLNLRYNRLKSDQEFGSLLQLLTNSEQTLERLDISHTGMTYDNMVRLVEFFEGSGSRMKLQALIMASKEIQNDSMLLERMKSALKGAQIIWN
ncbi:uncharacterized protein LOC135691647 [Rhopilema esculentum]|uniref:uncharacterized protein LOC135691647 n=1 Tax=Rhopilema esculentum TaxID=499914 RepID=UPI0031E22164|eukprot:gene9573-17326_t